MSLPCLREDLPEPSSFTVTQLPYVAKLDQNESPVDLPAELKREILAEVERREWNRYPQPAQYAEARERLADAIGVPGDRVFLTVGGDQTILSAFHVGGGPGRRARWFEPTYPYIRLSARVTHTEADAVPLGSGLCAALTAEDALAAPATDLIAFVSPNNPTGDAPPDAVIEASLADDRRLVFVDEAYADFAGRTRIAEAGARDNLMVGRSLSKAGLAGARLGFVVAHPAIVSALEQLFTAPYHLNQLQLAVAARYAEVHRHVAAAAAAVSAERQRVGRELAAIEGVEPRPSETNFILFRVVGDASAVYRTLADRGVRIRDVSRLPQLAGHLRVTVGTPADDDRFLEALRAAV